MADKIYLKSVFAYREDTLKNWEDKNPVLERGEPAVARDGEDGKWLKIGDGVTPFKSLPWKSGPIGPMGPQGQQGIRGDAGPQGPQGEKGDTYELTDADKTDIANLVLANFTDVSEVGV